MTPKQSLWSLKQSLWAPKQLLCAPKHFGGLKNSGCGLKNVGSKTAPVGSKTRFVGSKTMLVAPKQRLWAPKECVRVPKQRLCASFLFCGFQNSACGRAVSLILFTLARPQIYHFACQGKHNHRIRLPCKLQKYANGLVWKSCLTEVWVLFGCPIVQPRKKEIP